MEHARVVYKTQHSAILDISMQPMLSKQSDKGSYNMEKLKENFSQMDEFEWDLFQVNDDTDKLVITL
jgi:hypothetical protein